MARPLNPRQLKFVELYLAGHSATDAYVQAGYTARGHAAEAGATRLLRNAEVSAAVDAARSRAIDKRGITAERVLTELERIAFLDPRSLFNEDDSLKPIPELDDNTAATVAGFEAEESEATEGTKTTRTIKVKFVNKLGALTTLGRHFGLWNCDLPPLEQVLTQLPPEFAAAVRQRLAEVEIANQPTPPPAG